MQLVLSSDWKCVSNAKLVLREPHVYMKVYDVKNELCNALNA